MALNEGQIVTLAVDEIIETISAITPMAQKAKKYTPACCFYAALQQYHLDACRAGVPHSGGLGFN